MDENQGYVILQSILFDNGRGIALGEHPREEHNLVHIEPVPFIGRNPPCRGMGLYNIPHLFQV